MKFTFRNLGPIEAAEGLRLGEFTVIAGKNNTGKTYLSYALHGFLQLIRYSGNIFLSSGANHPMAEAMQILHMPGEENLQGRARYVTGRVPISEVNNAVNAALRDLAQFYRTSAHHVFASAKELEGFAIDCRSDGIKWDDFDFTVRHKDLLSMGFQGRHAQTLNSIKFRREGENLVYTAEDSRYPDSASEVVATGILSGCHLATITDSFVLPSERFGVSLFYKELDFTKNRLVEALQTMSDKDRKPFDPFLFMMKNSARYAQPIKNHIDFTRDLDEIQKKTGPLHEQKLFDNIKDMMEAYYKHEGYDLMFISKARGKNAFRIPLYRGSSSSRGLSGFYFYLKHIARRGQLLIVDEPEAHLHPVNQVAVARLLARCVNAGLRVLITTHSDYIIKELNNLIMLSQDFQGKEVFLSKHRKHYDEHDFLKRDDVRAYICEKGGLTKCEIDSRGIIMDSFNDPILEIDRISTELDARLPDEDE